MKLPERHPLSTWSETEVTQARPLTSGTTARWPPTFYFYIIDSYTLYCSYIIYPLTTFWVPRMINIRKSGTMLVIINWTSGGACLFLIEPPLQWEWNDPPPRKTSIGLAKVQERFGGEPSPEWLQWCGASSIHFPTISLLGFFGWVWYGTAVN